MTPQDYVKKFEELASLCTRILFQNCLQVKFALFKAKKIHVYRVPPAPNYSFVLGVSGPGEPFSNWNISSNLKPNSKKVRVSIGEPYVVDPWKKRSKKSHSTAPLFYYFV
jgi:hypothetical protein